MKLIRELPNALPKSALLSKPRLTELEISKILRTYIFLSELTISLRFIYPFRWRELRWRSRDTLPRGIISTWIRLLTVFLSLSWNRMTDFESECWLSQTVFRTVSSLSWNQQKSPTTTWSQQRISIWSKQKKRPEKAFCSLVFNNRTTEKSLSLEIIQNLWITNLVQR